MAEYKGKILKGIFTRAAKCLTNNGTSVEEALSNLDLIADDVANTSTQVDLSQYSELIILMWLGGKSGGATFTSVNSPILIGCKTRPIFGDTYIIVSITSTGLSYSASIGSYTGSTVSVYGRKK